MKIKIALILSSIITAFVILSVSLLKSAGYGVPFSLSILSYAQESGKDDLNSVDITYDLPYPGKILPDSPFWYFKAFRDKLLLSFTFDNQKKAELMLLCADKRVQMAQSLFEKGKPDLGIGTLSRSQMYLIEAVKKGTDDTAFVEKLANSSLKHREIIEENILDKSPEDLKPQIIKIEDYTKISYTDAKDLLHSKGITLPKNPFESE